MLILEIEDWLLIFISEENSITCKRFHKITEIGGMARHQNWVIKCDPWIWLIVVLLKDK
jgi:hypothetical protein